MGLSPSSQSSPLQQFRKIRAMPNLPATYLAWSINAVPAPLLSDSSLRSVKRYRTSRNGSGWSCSASAVRRDVRIVPPKPWRPRRGNRSHQLVVCSYLSRMTGDSSTSYVLVHRPLRYSLSSRLYSSLGRSARWAALSRDMALGCLCRAIWSSRYHPQIPLCFAAHVCKPWKLAAKSRGDVGVGVGVASSHLHIH